MFDKPTKNKKVDNKDIYDIIMNNVLVEYYISIINV